MAPFNPTFLTSTAATVSAYAAYEVYLGYEESANPDLDTRWIVILHGTMNKSCTWYTTAKLPKLDGYYRHEKMCMSGKKAHTPCEYNVSKKQIGWLGEDDRILFDALFEAIEARKSRKAIAVWLEGLAGEGLLDGASYRRVMREFEMLR
ncbi:hypothetical protein BJX64DRAFT_291914 [Aspergillus heterothallicus]